jgi:hypothetical protein
MQQMYQEKKKNIYTDLAFELLNMIFSILYLFWYAMPNVYLKQWFSTVVRPRPGKFFFYTTRARYRAAARRLRNTDSKHHEIHALE